MKVENMRMKEEIIYVPQCEGLPFRIVITGTSFCDGSYKIQRGCSDILCIEYIVSGCGTVRRGREIFHPKAGDMYMLPLSSEHEYFSDGADPWTKIWFNADGSLCRQLLSLYGLENKTYFEHCNGERFIRNIHEICTDDTLPAAEKQGRCAEVFFALIRFLADSVRGGKRSEAERLREFLEENISLPLGIGDMAEYIDRSPSQTIRLFRAAYDATPYAYFLRRKMVYAGEMLKNTNLHISAVAEAVGFSDAHYFSLLFKKHTGKTPGAYRRGE